VTRHSGSSARPRNPPGAPATAQLSAGTFWAMLAPAERALLSQAGTARRFGRGSCLCRQGERLRHVFVLLGGWVEITADTRTGYEGVLAVRGPGDIIGEMAVVDGNPRSATVRALDQVDAIVLAADQFAALCRSRPGLAWSVLSVVVTRLRELSRRRAEDAGSTVRQRLVVLLVELAARYGIPQEDGITIALPVTQQSLAGMVAASRESVVRGLGDLRRQRLIRTGRRCLVILRPDELRRLASRTRGAQ
jgi:CRP/FNR family transcriptional regulator, cyclic AMP receptor protein